MKSHNHQNPDIPAALHPIKAILAVTAALCMCAALFACGAENEQPPATHSPAVTTQPEPWPSGGSSTAPGTQQTAESEAQTTDPTQPVGINPAGFPSREILRGASDPSALTHTGLRALMPREIAIADPNNSKNLPMKKIEHAYGVAKDEMPHQISVDFQRFFTEKHYAAVAYDNITTDKVLYLTFDCGYENGNTAKILDVLKEKKVPAAFFCTVDEMKGAPDIVARMINEGHIVGNHSVKHPSFAEIDRTRMAQEILGADNYLREHFGYSAPFFRFPKGEYTESALEAVASLGFTSVFWSAAYADWDVSAQKGGQYALDTVMSRIHPGAILLLHSISQDNADAMAQIIDQARARGYEFRDLTALAQFYP